MTLKSSAVFLELSADQNYNYIIDAKFNDFQKNSLYYSYLSGRCIIMAQSNWTYHGASGRSYHVGLYHGDDSGHVIIYCNNNILTIDFEVNEDKSYSFYLEHDLCELSLTETDNGYEYDFNIAEAAPPIETSSSEIAPLDYVFLGLVGLLFFSIIFSFAAAIS